MAQTSVSADETAIRERLAGYAAAREHGDVHAEAMAYSEDGEFRAFGGAVVQGRAAIEKTLTVANPTYHFVLNIERVHFLEPNVAIAETAVRAGPEAGPISMVATYVMVKRKGEWLIGAARVGRAGDSPVAKPAAPKP
jgi:uncharacterized protein (TIGR02246 family)